MFAGRLPRAPMGELMGFSGGEAGLGFVVFEAVPAAAHFNPLGQVHGGFAATILDSCMGCAVHTVLGPGVGYTTVDLMVTFDRAIGAGTGTVYARGEVVTHGRRIATATGRLTDARGKLLAHGSATCMILPREGVG